MTDIDRLEAIGSRGEACIILRGKTQMPNGEAQEAYALATGERLRTVGVSDEFETLDGRRHFKLRGHPRQAPHQGAVAGISPVSHTGQTG